MIRTSAPTGAVVGATVFGGSVFGGSVDDEPGGAAAMVVVTGLAEWLLEHAASARNATVTDNEATRDRRITRS
jgi:hypothetical protein